METINCNPKRISPIRMLGYESHPEAVRRLNSIQAEAIARDITCICLSGSPPNELCKLTRGSVDGTDCESFDIISCPDLRTLVEDYHGEVASRFNQEFVEVATKFYRGLMLIHDRRK